MQLEQITKYRDRQTTANRVKFREASTDATNFSSVQMESFLKRTEFRQKVDKMRDAMNLAAGFGEEGAKPIASLTGRSFVFKDAADGTTLASLLRFLQQPQCLPDASQVHCCIEALMMHALLAVVCNQSTRHEHTSSHGQHDHMHKLQSYRVQSAACAGKEAPRIEVPKAKRGNLTDWNKRILRETQAGRSMTSEAAVHVSMPPALSFQRSASSALPVSARLLPTACTLL